MYVLVAVFWWVLQQVLWKCAFSISLLFVEAEPKCTRSVSSYQQSCFDLPSGRLCTRSLDHYLTKQVCLTEKLIFPRLLPISVICWVMIKLKPFSDDTLVAHTKKVSILPFFFNFHVKHFGNLWGKWRMVQNQVTTTLQTTACPQESLRPQYSGKMLLNEYVSLVMNWLHNCFVLVWFCFCVYGVFGLTGRWLIPYYENVPICCGSRIAVAELVEFWLYFLLLSNDNFVFQWEGDQPSWHVTYPCMAVGAAAISSFSTDRYITLKNVKLCWLMGYNIHYKHNITESFCKWRDLVYQNKQ